MKLALNTNIIFKDERVPVKTAVSILERDIKKCFNSINTEGGSIILKSDKAIADEDFVITVDETAMTVTANDELGFVYGLLYISKNWLGIKPFWFWLDQRITPISSIEIAPGEYRDIKPIVKYRGWFINDEVLIMKWSVNGDNREPWKMAFEALLRCGGNTVIPGTDKNSRMNRQLAASYGLWLTHHHAEPLGAEMFIREYPDLKPNYFEHKEKFHKLWRDAVEEQKDLKVVWSVGFRGQGDCPFWSGDTSGRFTTDESRGKLISEITELQRQMVFESVKNPVFCTNLYGEVMELYDGGHISFDDNIIKVSADNGFGKMVTRRRDNHTARVSSMPKEPLNHGGIYYHVSFYDLQAANHITMLPNSVDFVNSELDEVNKMNMNDFWIINCSNIRPHAYYLDAVSKKWFGKDISDEKQSAEFAAEYYGSEMGISDCLCKYHNAMIAFGENEDEHAGEQFYAENTRVLANNIMRGDIEQCQSMKWLTGDIPLDEQIKAFTALCGAYSDKLENYYRLCENESLKLKDDTKELFDSTVLLQSKIHYYCCMGVKLFGLAYTAYKEKNYFKAFMLFGDAAEKFSGADKAMRNSEYGIWNGFYYNECFADCKHTAYVLRKLRGLVREYGDNARHDEWYRQLMYKKEDRGVFALLILDNHMEDEDIYKEAKKRLKNGVYELPVD